MSATAEIDALVGTLVGGRYRLVRRVGEGGMGSVYLADHIELDRKVAIKLLAPEMARNRTAVERFQREARTASKIGHVNIVDVFDLGRSEDGTPFLAMECLDGEDLEAELERDGRLEPARVLEVLTPVARALDVCHQHGVIHRDLKPSNVFLAKLPDGSECPKLVDFGLAMLHVGDERLTRTGFIAGTPFYMPPEAAEGELAGPPGDIYALAVMAYEGLCGALPFESTIATGVLVKKVVDDAPSMAERTGAEFPAAVEEVLERGLARDPNERQATAGLFMKELKNALETEPVDRSSKTRPIPLSRPLGHSATAEAPIPMRRLSARWVWLGVVLLLPVLALTGWWASTRPGSEEHVSTVEPEVEPPPPGEPASSSERALTAAPVPEAAEPETPSADTPHEAETTEALAPSPTGRPAGPRAPSTQHAGPAPAIAARPSEAAEPARRVGTPAPAPAAPEAPSRDRAEAERLVRSAGSLLIRGELAGALTLLERAREADPRYAPTYRSLGLVHEQAQRRSAARAAYARYLQLAPGAADANRIRSRADAL